MEAIFKRLVPAVPFDYKFTDTEYGYKFAAEERIDKLASVFATLAISISCLGLLGLAAFVAKRTKEIGIRKVLGATVLQPVATAIKRICAAGIYLLPDSHSTCLLFPATVVAEV